MTANAAENAAPRQSLRDAGALLWQTGLQALTEISEGLGQVGDQAGEERAIYRLVAEYVADQLGLRYDVVLPAVAALCDATPYPDEQTLAAVRKWLLRLRITYASPRTGPVTRTVEMIVDPTPAGARVRTVEQRMSRDDLPADVRQHMLRTGSHEVTFQPYPRSN